MANLSEALLRPEVRPTVVRDCCALVDDEVKAKSGLAGIAIKAAYAAVKAMKATIIPEVVEGMLDDMVKNLEPFWDAFQKDGGGQPFETYLASRSSQVAEALLAISDDRATATRHASLRKAYEKLRPQGKKNVEQAVPRIGQLVARHTR